MSVDISYNNCTYMVYVQFQALCISSRWVRET